MNGMGFLQNLYQNWFDSPGIKICHDKMFYWLEENYRKLNISFELERYLQPYIMER